MTPAPYFNPILDGPTALVSNLLEGELTGRGARKLLTDPMSLTPSERDTIVSRLKEKAGRNPVAGSLIDIVTNPWVWFLAMTSPAGMGVLSNTGRNLYSVPRKMTALAREHGGLLSTFGLTTGNVDLRGTALPAGLRQLTRVLGKHYKDEHDALAPTLSAMMQRANVPHLDFNRLSGPQRERAQVLSDALYAYMGKLDKDVNQTVVRRLNRKGIRNLEKGLAKGEVTGWEQLHQLPPVKSGKNKGEIYTYVLIDKKRPAWITTDAKENLRRIGGDEAVAFADTITNYSRERYSSLVKDKDQILRLYGLLHNRALTSYKGKPVQGLELLRYVAGGLLEEAGKGKLSPEQFTKLVEGIARGPLKTEGYVPFNIVEHFQGGKNMQRQLSPNVARAIGVAGLAVPRTYRGNFIHPDDLARLAQFGATPALQKELAGATKAMLDPVQERRFYRIHTQKQWQKYMTDTARQLALTDAPDAAVRAANRQSVSEYKDTRITGLKPFYRKGEKGQSQIPMGKALQDLEDAGVEPAGGFSVMDAIAADFAHLQNAKSAERVMSVLIPRALGHSTLQDTVGREVLYRLKDMVGGFVSTDAGAAVGKAGGLGQKWFEAAKRFAEEPVHVGEATGLGIGASKWLYASHLGGNLGSAILNMTQPMLHASVLGADNVAWGYKEAFKDILSYTDSRLKEGFAPLGKEARKERLRQHFRLSRVGRSQEDLLSILGSELELLEGQLVGSGVLGTAKENVGEKLFNASMFMFQKSEIMNRTVSGYAALRSRSKRLTKSGLPSKLEEVPQGKWQGKDFTDIDLDTANEVRQVVDDFQFGTNYLNTPWALQPGAVLGNPLLKQFLTFTLRSGSLLFSVSPQLDEGKRFLRTGQQIPLPATAVDFGRMLGMSAVMMAVGRNFFDTEPIEFTPLAAVSEIIPGIRSGRFDENESALPIPPVIDIPFQGWKALLKEDKETWGHTLSRLVPGGVALSRALGAVPNLDAPWPVNLQRTYADWQNPSPDGTVPVFKSDGTLMDYRQPRDLALRAFGVDLGRWGEPGDFDRWLNKNRDEINMYRTRAKDAMLKGNMGEYKSLQGEFGKRFKTPEGQPMPLLVTQQELKQHVLNRTASRPERILDRFPQNLRPTYQKILAEQEASRLGIPPNQLQGLGTAKTRRAPVQLPPEVMEALQRQERVGPAATSQDRSFEGYEGY